MRILQIGKFYPIRGGVEKVMWDLTCGLSALGIDCDMLCAHLENDVKEIDLNEHGRVICVPAITKKASTMIAPSMIKYMREHCNEYDIVHIHHPDPMACLALKLSGFSGKVIVHWHSDIISQKLGLGLYRPLQNWMLRRATKIIGTTPIYVQQSGELQKFKDKLDYVPIGIKPMKFDEEKASKVRKKYDGKKIVLSIGRLVPYKGYGYLIGAMQYLSEDYHLIIGGEGPLKNDLINQIDMLGLQDRVTMAGYVPEEDLSVLFGACSIFVLSSIMKTEAFGIVQLEAFSCGRPVVATKIPESGVPWVNEDGYSGLNVPIKNSKAIADAIVNICGGDYWYFAKNALDRYNKVFTYGKMINKIKNIYEKIL